MKEECGVFGIYGVEEASKYTYLGLYALQHRGQESAGIVSSDGKKLYPYMKMGLVADAFDNETLKKLSGKLAIGHCRYSTTGSSNIKNAQPVSVSYSRGSISLAHNGNLTNAEIIRSELEAYGSIFSSTTDSEVIIHLISRSDKKDFIDTIVDALSKVKGAYSLLIMNEKTLIGVCDPQGFRPLSIGKFKNGFVLASETCAFDIIEAEYLRTVEPGELILIDKDGLKSLKLFSKTKHAHCIFEFIYFARPDSYIFGRSCHDVRKQLGRELAKEHPVEADLVIPVPDSSICAALGYSQESGIPFEMGLIRNHYVGRTFIEPSQSIRDFGAKVKYNPVKKALEGKRIIVVDDSIVRGTTSRKLVKMLKKSNPKEIHWRISSSPITHPCFFGIDTPRKEELIGSKKTVEEIRKYLEVNTLGYLSIKGMINSVKDDRDKYCLACFNGEYPIDVSGNHGKFEIESKTFLDAN